jgi:hypothetical protein
MPWPVFFYLPRPDAASSALSALRDILIALHASSCTGLYVMSLLLREHAESAGRGHSRAAGRNAWEDGVGSALPATEPSGAGFAPEGTRWPEP